MKLHTFDLASQVSCEVAQLVSMDPYDRLISVQAVYCILQAWGGVGDERVGCTWGGMEVGELWARNGADMGGIMGVGMSGKEYGSVVAHPRVSAHHWMVDSGDVAHRWHQVADGGDEAPLQSGSSR